MNKAIRLTLGWIIVGLISLASVSFYWTVRQAVEDMLTMFGIYNFYTQSAVIIIGAILIITLLKFTILKRISLINTIADIFKL